MGDDLLAFIDDDETPGPGWLAALVATRDRHGADAVAGPVVSRYDGNLDPWVQAGGYFDREHHQGRRDGSVLTRAASNNLLLDLNTVRRLGVRFDDAYGLSGGEDSLFTETLTQRGATIRWSSAAAVNDNLPAERLTRKYALQRTYDLSNSSAGVELDLVKNPGTRRRLKVRAAAVAAARLAAPGAAEITFGRLTRSQRHDAHGWRSVARGRGAMAAVIGQHSSSYGASNPAAAVGPRLNAPSQRTIWVAHPSSDLYGSDLQLVETVRGLREGGHEVVVLLPREGPLSARFTAIWATVIFLPARARPAQGVAFSPTAAPPRTAARPFHVWTAPRTHGCPAGRSARQHRDDPDLAGRGPCGTRPRSVPRA